MIQSKSHDWQTTGLMLHVKCHWLLALLIVCVTARSDAADRTTYFLPLASEAATVPIGAGSAAGKSGDQQQSAVMPHQAYGDAAGRSWAAYMQVWRSHHNRPDSPAIRRFLTLPVGEAIEATPRRGRSAPRWLDWRLGSYQQIDTPHFQIFSHAPDEVSRFVARDLEQCYWVWTQAFFPLWEGREQVALVLKDLPIESESVAVDTEAFLAASRARITVRRKLRVVLFGDRAEYMAALGPTHPGVSQSTGFYSDDKKTIFLFASESDDAATRRHELTHQLFREATRSSLGNRIPGEGSGFWLVEGIAGYAESMRLFSTTATIGGWDSPRLQFARFRVLASGDLMPQQDLINDGRLEAQQRQDIARWYAHAIAQTHAQMDGNGFQGRAEVYRQLAELYQVSLKSPKAPSVQLRDRALVQFLKVDDKLLHENRNFAVGTQASALRSLCLAGCEVTSAGLQGIEPSAELDWLDLSRLPVKTADVERLVSGPNQLTQLSLEATQVDSSISILVAKCVNLQELDLSWTQAGDEIIESIAPSAPIETLWLTGTQVSDQAVDRIIGMKSLSAIDLQRSRVTTEGLQRLKQRRPRLVVNPLELREAASGE